jgi:hypothetical protein
MGLGGFGVMTANELVAKHKVNKLWLTLAAADYKSRIAAVEKEQAVIENQLFEMLQALGGSKQSLKTDSGTAYISVITTPKVSDRDAYLIAVMDNYDTWGSGLLQVGAPKKEALDEYMREYEHLPPGVETSSFMRVNVRHS